MEIQEKWCPAQPYECKEGYYFNDLACDCFRVANCKILC